MRFVLLALAASALSAQTFDSVSVKPFVPQDDDSAPVREPGSMVYSNVSLKLLITAAYSVRPDQISGPAWLDTERYDIVGKPPAGATKDQVPAMLQHLLADRFRINVQVEERQRPGYALVASKDGVKIPAVEGDYRRRCERCRGPRRHSWRDRGCFCRACWRHSPANLLPMKPGSKELTISG